MKLATSTGDFTHYTASVADEIRAFRGSPFRCINLEQQAELCPELFLTDDVSWRKLADDWARAAQDAAVTLAVAHAPCVNVFQDLSEETYAVHLRAIRRSIELCHLLNIRRIVVHSCHHFSFSRQETFNRNRQLYSQLFDLMERFGITVMVENWASAETFLTTGAELAEFLDNVDHPLLAACWDTAHGNIDPAARALGQYENITALGKRLKGVHIADNFGDVHHHSWPFAGIVNFDAVMQGLLDVAYDGLFTFEASYTLLHHRNLPYYRQVWQKDSQAVTHLLDPSLSLKQQAVGLLYETGKHILTTYDCFEE